MMTYSKDAVYSPSVPQMNAAAARPFATPALRSPSNFRISNRKCALLEPLATRRKQATAARSNRKFSHSWIFRRIDLAVPRPKTRDDSPLLPGHPIWPLTSASIRWERRAGCRQKRWRRIFRDGWRLLRRQCRHQRHCVVPGRCEFVPVALRYWIGWGQREALEVQEFFAALDAEIQVRAGGEAGHAHQANPLALFDALAGMHQHARKVHVISGVTVVVLDLDQVAGAAFSAGENHAAIADRLHGSAGGRGVINAQVRAVFFQNGMIAVLAEMRSNHRGKFQRRMQKGLLHGLPFRRVIRGRA